MQRCNIWSLATQRFLNTPPKVHPLAPLTAANIEREMAVWRESRHEGFRSPYPYDLGKLRKIAREGDALDVTSPVTGYTKAA